MEHDGPCDADFTFVEVNITDLRPKSRSSVSLFRRPQAQACVPGTEYSNEPLNFACAEYHGNCFSLCTLSYELIGLRSQISDGGAKLELTKQVESGRLSSSVDRSLYPRWLRIADEYRMTDSCGKLIVLGLNLRTYDNSKQIWSLNG